MSNHDTQNHDAEVEIALSGWLMKRCRLTKKWKRTWFTLRSSNLCYGKSENGPFKNIPLQSTVIEEAHINDMSYVFRLRPPKSKRDYIIQAPDEQTEQRWMQAICFAKVGANSSESSQACTVQ
uniref:PH domain-containing protein DDB_G0274775-like n=1 Tax=Styela clava TaxID=7725 RepID=UPI00193A2EF2|nr:PH domain-containing protein DDB_G0274775-like [Styela clava]